MKNRNTLLKWTAILASITLLIGFVTSSHATPPKGMEIGDAVVVTAEVVGIDKADRVVTLEGASGNIVEIKAGDEVRNFNQIKVGDKVKVTYYESVAIYLGVPGSQPEADAAKVIVRAAKGEKPGAMMVGAIDISANVKGINKKKRELTLEMPDGSVVKRAVDPAVKAFDEIKVGDTIHVRLTRAMAIAVEAP